LRKPIKSVEKLSLKQNYFHVHLFAIEKIKNKKNNKKKIKNGNNKLYSSFCHKQSIKKMKIIIIKTFDINSKV
jgi:hypothetical protein